MDDRKRRTRRSRRSRAEGWSRFDIPSTAWALAWVPGNAVTFGISPQSVAGSEQSADVMAADFRGTTSARNLACVASVPW